MVVTFLVVLCVHLARGQLIVDTRYGQVQGQMVPMGAERPVYSFTGIPYARPPVGENRFKAPEEPERWEGILNGTILPAQCPQRGGPIEITHPHWENFQEDCLYLNIYTPLAQAGANMPVMVWFHGGAYRNSGNVMYPGHFYAIKNVVMVSVNYRLGCLGFATSGDDVSRGNYGMLDQRMSLLFVRDNIVNFGGNPDRVTIFGQSAGGSSVGLHVLSPLSRDLFHQAIMMSGSDLVPWSWNPVWLPPENYTKEVADHFNCTYNTPAEMMACLRTIPAMDLAGFRETPMSGWISQGFQPVVDGPGGFLPEDPFTARSNGNFKQDAVVMIGHTTEDGSGYLLPFVPEAVDGGWNRSMHEYYIRTRMVDWVYARSPEHIKEDVTQGFRYYYTDWPQDEDGERNRMKAVEAVTDVGFGVGQDMVIKNHTQYATTWEYYSGFIGDGVAEIVPQWMGALHGSDIPYWFGFPRYPDFPEAQDAAEFWSMDLFNHTQTDKEHSDFLITLATNFAKTGNPTDTPVPGPGGKPPVTWEPFRADDMKYLFIGNDVIENRINLRQRNNALWQTYMEYLADPNRGNPESSTAWQWDYEAEAMLHENMKWKLLDIIPLSQYADKLQK